MKEAATLYIVATPIGTLGDLSPRAKDVLASVGFIICEDTRHTGKLLHTLGIHASLESLHAHNEQVKSSVLIKKLLDSPTRSAAIVTDAGTPCISDPGALLIAAAHTHHIRVLNVPGPSSLVSALAASGFLRPRSLFSGFIGRSNRERCDEFHRWKSMAPCIAVFFESPKRLTETLSALKEFFSDRDIRICVSREISKMFEENLVGSIEDVLHNFSSRAQIPGEVTVCVDLPEEIISTDDMENSTEIARKEILSAITQGTPMKQACKEAATRHRLNSKELYRLIILSQSK